MCPGGGPVLGRGSRGVGQSGPAETPDEAPGGMSEDVGRAVFCCEYSLDLVIHVDICVCAPHIKLFPSSISLHGCKTALRRNSSQATCF